MCGPRVIVIGAQKGGTTALAEYAKQTTWMKLGVRKELHFFDAWIKSGRSKEDKTAMQRKYLELFPVQPLISPNGAYSMSRWSHFGFSRINPFCSEYQTNLSYQYNQDAVLADITPIYMITPGAPEMIQSVTNDPFIVMLLRDPSERALSAFRMNWRNQAIPDNVKKNQSMFASRFNSQVRKGIGLSEECLTSQACQERAIGKNSSESLVWRGLYSIHLSSWFKVYPKNRVVIWVSEDFSNDPGRYLQDLRHQILPEYSLRMLDRKRTPYARVFTDPLRLSPWNTTMEALRVYFKPYNAKLIRLLQQKGYHAAVSHILNNWENSIY
jgi:hypothetical protein